jgi:branched-chain amino acid transport system permease protein
VSYYMVGLVVVGCYFALQRIVHSPFGRVLVAIRENEERARAVGYDTFRYKLGAFALSAFFAGVAGGLFAGFRRSVTPENSFYFLVAGDALLASIIGGFGTVAGPLYGRLFDETVREFLSKGGEGGGLLPFLDGSLGEATLSAVLYDGLTVGEAIDTFLNGHAALYLGIVFVLFVLYVPNGLLGTLRDRLGGTVADRLPGRVARAVGARTENRPAGDDD